MTLTTARPKRSADSLAPAHPTPPTKRRPKPKNFTHSQSQSLFFHLPHEIRQHVFLLALAKPAFASLLDSAHDDSVDAEPALLSTCHRIRVEALPLFYSSNDWVIKTRRVGSDAGRLDPVSKRLVTYQCIPRWLDALPADKIALMRSVVAVGSRGSYVDFKGKWWDGERVAFRLQTASARVAYAVTELQCEDEEEKITKKARDKEAFCSVYLVDLLNARMRISGQNARGKKWLWTRESVHEIAFLL